MPAFNEITPAKLNRLIGTPDLPPLFDLRIEADFEDDPRVLPGAMRHSHSDPEGLIRKIHAHAHASQSNPSVQSPAKALLYCQKSRKISHGVAALLRIEGIEVEVLSGGQIGWIAAGFPTVSHLDQLRRDAQGASLWVTRQRPKIDRIACPWLIRRFIDPMARILFVPTQDVELVAERFGATPFDIEGAQFSHRGDLCSFDAILADFGLTSEALEQMALVVRAADTNQHALAPQAAGLLAIAVGLSRMYRDDLQQLEAGLGVFDALYRWARDAMDEEHDWPKGAGA